MCDSATIHVAMLTTSALTMHAEILIQPCLTEWRLDFVATFYFHRSVGMPSADDATSWIASDVTVAGQRGAVALLRPIRASSQRQKVSRRLRRKRPKRFTQVHR